MPQSKQHEKVRFEYTDGQDYRLVHATGAQGGMTPTGLVKFDLYSEFGLSPEYEEFQLTPDGKLASKLSEDGVGDTLYVKRELQVGVVMSPKDAHQLGLWLLERAKQAKEASDAATASPMKQKEG